MEEIELDLSVGDVVCLGDCTVTVIDIDGPVVSFRVDRDDDLIAATTDEPHLASIAFHEVE